MADKPTRGDEVYDAGGARYEYLVELPDEGHVVRKLWVEDGYEDDEPVYDEPTTLRLVFTEPPVRHINEEVKAATEKLRAVKAEICETESELRLLRHELPKRLEELRKRSAAVQRLEDFLDGNITHMVVCQEYRAPEMGTLEEITKATSSYDDWKWKLVTLHGKTGGDLEFRLHQYSTGGDSVKVVPCTSEADARAELTKHIQSRIEDVEAMSNRPLASLEREMSAADRYGIPFPDEIRKAIHDSKVASARGSVERHENELKKAKLALALVEESSP